MPPHHPALALAVVLLLTACAPSPAKPQAGSVPPSVASLNVMLAKKGKQKKGNGKKGGQSQQPAKITDFDKTGLKPPLHVYNPNYLCKVVPPDLCGRNAIGQGCSGVCILGGLINSDLGLVYSCGTGDSAINLGKTICWTPG